MDETYDLALLAESRAKWARSPALRTAYRDIYRHMVSFSRSGPALEVGSGCGTMPEFHPGVVTSDVRATDYVATVASAYDLPAVEGPGAWSTLYGLDVLHHLRDPFRFFSSAAAALKPGGRLVLCEPAATLLGRVVYRLVHEEPVDLDRVSAPYQFEPAAGRHGTFANMAIAWALFVRDREAVSKALTPLGLSVHAIEFRDVLAYASTGGFSGRALVPARIVAALLAMEHHLPAWLMRFVALRMVIVVEKKGEGHR